MNTDLNLAEQFLLLAQHPEKGRYNITGIHLQYGLIGAVLLDLSLNKALSVENKKFKAHSDIDLHTLEYSSHKLIYDTIHHSERRKNVGRWIRKFATKSRKIRREIQHGMRKKNLISIESKKFLFIPYIACYLRDRRTYKSLISHLNNIVLYHKEKTEEELSLLGLLHACQMHRIIAKDRSELKTIKKELKEIAKNENISQTINATIRQVQLAINAAIAANTAATAGAGR